jgi:hypothetical protein
VDQPSVAVVREDDRFVAVWVIPADEDDLIARPTLDALRGERRLDWAESQAEEIA